MMYDILCKEARQISSTSLAVPMDQERWEATVDERREMWLQMLGLWPTPERTPLEATITGTLERGDYVVEKIHYQPVPDAYVAGNVYRPVEIDEPLPAVLYLCGHTKGKVNPPYQANPRWFGEHGYVALVVDPIQLGECQGMHHGTFREGRWDWQSRGYTPAGTEVWNAIRALDYLQEREDVDAERMGVTGLSGGGVISWCLGAADQRVKCVAPVCQTGSIEHVVVDRATDGHCDCAFFINYYRWCQPDIGALIAPRALLVASGTEDVLWRPYAFRDVCHRIKHQYAELGVAERMGLVQDLTPHGYTPKLRKAIFTWFNRHLKGDDSEVEEDITAHVEPEENLLVFGGSPPEHDRMREIDTLVVRLADVPEIESAEQWRQVRQEKLDELCELTFRHVSETPTPGKVEYRADGASRSTGDPPITTVFGTYAFDTTDELTLRVKTATPQEVGRPVPTVALALPETAQSGFCGAGRHRPNVGTKAATACVEVRNTSVTSVGPGYLWTMRRAYPLLGKTLPERQTSDLLAGIAVMREQQVTGPIAVYGEGDTAVLAIYAGILDPDVTELILVDPPETHTDPDTPEFLGILQIGDLPQNLALFFPRSITFIGEMPEAYDWTRDLYDRCGAGDRLRVIESIGDWEPVEGS